MTEPLTITVHGRPAPQGSKRAFAIKKGGVPTGKVAVIESSHDRVKSWRQAVIDAALEAAGPTLVRERLPLNGPTIALMVFFLPRPKGHYRTGRNAAQLRDSAPAWPSKTPDLSKLCRATEDALVDAGMLADDALIVEYERLCKYYAGTPGVLYGGGTLRTPGAVITIREMA
jgi:Holliday junction resolvase RusA-like endonuclease